MFSPFWIDDFFSVDNYSFLIQYKRVSVYLFIWFYSFMWLTCILSVYSNVCFPSVSCPTFKKLRILTNKNVCGCLWKVIVFGHMRLCNPWNCWPSLFFFLADDKLVYCYVSGKLPPAVWVDVQSKIQNFEAGNEAL